MKELQVEQALQYLSWKKLQILTMLQMTSEIQAIESSSWRHQSSEPLTDIQHCLEGVHMNWATLALIECHFEAECANLANRDWETAEKWQTMRSRCLLRVLMYWIFAPLFSGWPNKRSSDPWEELWFQGRHKKHSCMKCSLWKMHKEI